MIKARNINPTVLLLVLVAVVGLSPFFLAPFVEKTKTRSPATRAEAELYRFTVVCPVIQSSELFVIIKKLEKDPVLKSDDQTALEDFQRACATLAGRK